MERTFDGKVVVITGASAGIGRAAALKFAREGAKVVLAARKRGPLEETAAEVEAAGGRAHIVQADMGDVDDCARLIDEAVEAFGGVDVLVNNAGLHHRGGFGDHEARAFGTMVDVNLRAPIVLTRLALPYLRRGGGAVVQVASIAGRVPLPGAAVYSSTKFGLRAFSLALAEELREENVKFTVVSPGAVETGFILDDLKTVSALALSSPMSTSEQIADLVIDCARDGKPERVRPLSSATLATVAYLFPQMARVLRPLLAFKGERVRAKYTKLARE